MRLDGGTAATKPTSSTATSARSTRAISITPEIVSERAIRGRRATRGDRIASLVTISEVQEERTDDRQTGPGNRAARAHVWTGGRPPGRRPGEARGRDALGALRHRAAGVVRPRRGS